MFNRLGTILRDIIDPVAGVDFAENDPRPAAAALLFHAISIDGTITPAEKDKVLAVIGRLYGLDARAAAHLYATGRERMLPSGAQEMVAEIRLYMSADERHALGAALWEAIAADGEIHEFEETLLWRLSADLGLPVEDIEGLRRRSGGG